MNRRTLTILAGIGAALLAVLLLARLDFAGEGSAGKLHAPGLADRLDSLQSMRVVAAGNQVVATVERGDAGWVVAERGGHRVDFERFRNSLRALSQARRVERKTAMAEYYSRLGVEDVGDPDAAGFLLELDYGQQHPSEAFIVGRRAGAGMAYIRTAGDSQSWLVSADFDLSGQTRDWLDRAIIDLGAGEVHRVVLDRGAGGVLEIVKEDRGGINFTPAGIPEGRELSYGSVANSIGSVLSNVQANDARPAAEVRDLPRAVLARYESFDGLQVELDARADSPPAPEDADSAEDQDEPRYWVLFSATGADPAAETSGAALDEETTAGDSADQPAGSEPEETEAPDDLVADAGAPEDDADQPAGSEPEETEALDDLVADAGAPEDDAEQPVPSARERAAELNAQLGGWAYELPLYKSDQLFKKMDDLLKDE